MKLEPLGESAFILRDLGPWEAHRLSDAVDAARVPGVLETVCAYDTIGVYVDPTVFDRDRFETVAEALRPAAVEDGARRHTVPVCYDLGPDLPEVCDRLGLTPKRFAELHSGLAYKCFAIGFSPGFPYLGWLPEELRGVPRQESPRVRVPAGSVAITGTQTGIYPQETPGGWALIGRTPLELVNLRDEYFPIHAGDTIAFERINETAFRAMEGRRL